MEDNPYRVPDLLPDEYHELFSEYETFVEWSTKSMTDEQKALANRVLSKLRQADEDHVCLDEVDQGTFHGEQSVQFSSDDLARIIATVFSRVFEALSVQHTIEGIAVLPAGDSTYLVDIVLRDLSTKEVWGVSITIPPIEEEIDELR